MGNRKKNQGEIADHGSQICRLELGAGGGLVGLAVALGCGVESRLMLTDQDEMFELMKHNIGLNNVEDKATASILNWYGLITSLFASKDIVYQ